LIQYIKIAVLISSNLDLIASCVFISELHTITKIIDFPTTFGIHKVLTAAAAVAVVVTQLQLCVSVHDIQFCVLSEIVCRNFFY